MDKLEAAEARVATARRQLSEHVDTLKATVAKKAKSPYVIGGVAAGVAAGAYLLYQRSRKPRPVRVQSAPQASGIATVLTIAQLLAPLVGLGARQKAKPARPERAVVPSRAAAALPSPRAVQAPQAARIARPAQVPPVARPAGAWYLRQWHMIKEAVSAWIDDYAPSMGAALSYYTLFSLAPLLIIVIAVAGMIFGQDAAQGAIVAQMRGLIGEEGAVAIEGMLKAAREPAKGTVATIVGVVTLLIGSTAVFSELQSALDRIWRSPVNATKSGILHLLRTRVLSFGLVLGLGFLLMVSLVVSAALAALGTWWGSGAQGWETALVVINFAVSFGIFTVLFAMIYKIMPSVKISWHDVWTGAGVTALLFVIGKLLIGLYLGKSSIASGFGAAGSLVVLVAWVYYSAQVFLLGAEYTWVYAHRCGSKTAEAEAVPADPVPSRSE
jgi:membrane protein